MTSGLAKRRLQRSADFPFLDVFGRKIRWKTAMRSDIIFASPEVIHRPRVGLSVCLNTYVRFFARQTFFFSVYFGAGVSSCFISNLFFFVTGTIFVPVEIELVPAWVLASISLPHHDILETLPGRIKEQFMAQKSAVGVQYKRIHMRLIVLVCPQIILLSFSTVSFSQSD